MKLIRTDDLHISIKGPRREKSTGTWIKKKAKKNAERVPNMIFAKGPAKLTQKIPLLWFFRRLTSTGTGFGPTEHHPSQENPNQRKNYRSDHITMGHGVECEPALISGGGITELEGHIGMGGLMTDHGKEKPGNLNSKS